MKRLLLIFLAVRALAAGGQPAEILALGCGCRTFTNCPTFRLECFPTNVVVTYNLGGFPALTYGLETASVFPSSGAGGQEFFYVLTNGGYQIQWDNYYREPAIFTNTLILTGPVDVFTWQTNASLCGLATNSSWDPTEPTNPTALFGLVPVCYPDQISVTNSAMFNGTYNLQGTLYIPSVAGNLHVTATLTNRTAGPVLVVDAYYPPNPAVSNFAELSYGATNLFSYTNKDLCQMLPFTNTPSVWKFGDTNAPVLTFNCP